MNRNDYNSMISNSSNKKNSKNFFNYLITQRPDHAEIVIQFHTSFYTTRSIPATIPLLESTLPRIFSHKCFNNQNWSFKKEAKQTELGHLFEHIILEYLCVYKFLEGCSNIKLKGLTEWNWEQDPEGIFYISLNSVMNDSNHLTQATEKAAKIMEKLLDMSQTRHVS